jgi:hypothetical protein
MVCLCVKADKISPSASTKDEAPSTASITLIAGDVEAVPLVATSLSVVLDTELSATLDTTAPPPFPFVAVEAFLATEDFLVAEALFVPGLSWFLELSWSLELSSGMPQVTEPLLVQVY